MRSALLLVTLATAAFAADGGSMRNDVQRHVALMERVRATAPGESSVATAVLARLLSDTQWLEVLRSEKPATLYLPYFDGPDTAMLNAVTRATDGSSLAGFYGLGDVPVPPGSSVKREDNVGVVTVRWLVGTLPWASTTRPPPVVAVPVKLAPVDVAPLLEKNLAHVQSVDRVLLAPSLRAYARDLAASMGQTKLDPAALEFKTPSKSDVVACERAFLEAVARDLKDDTFKVVTKHRRYSFGELFTHFTKYEAQVTGWHVAGAHYLFFKYRLPSSHQSPLDREYHVSDGGSAYFEYQCQVPQRSLFDVYVHGEA